MEAIQKIVGAMSDWIGVLSAVISAVFAGLAWRKTRLIRQQQQADEQRRAAPIRLILVRTTDQQEHVLGYQPRRDQASRAELLGILGMYFGSPRFDSSYQVRLLESGEFSHMVDGSVSELRLPMSPDDFAIIADRDKKLGPDFPSDKGTTT